MYVRRNMYLYLALDVLDGIRGLDYKSNGLSNRGLAEDRIAPFHLEA